MAKITNSQIKFLRGLAHEIKPVVMVGGNGLTEAVLTEVENALTHHELIKIKVRAEDREEKAEIIHDICHKTNSTKVHVIGHNLTIYRLSKAKKIQLPR